MEAHHASLGRRTLEEIRQKRAVDRSYRQSSGSDLEGGASVHGSSRGESVGVTKERNPSVLLPRLQELEKKNVQLEDENRKLHLMLEEKEVEKETLLSRLNDIEYNTLPSLKKTLKDATIERDAAVVAREDLQAQLRAVRRRLKDAEDEQYRAEEDAAALRAELNSLQQQEVRNPFNDVTLVNKSAEDIQALEKEISELKSELLRESAVKQQCLQKLSEEQSRVSSLIAEKQELERRVTGFTKKALEDASEEEASQTLHKAEKEKLERQLHDMAVMVEKLESSRQKLLMEIDSQSSEIERLFDENSNLSSFYEEAKVSSEQWQNQLKECLKQNQELRIQLEKLRSDRTKLLQLKDMELGSSIERNLGSSQSSFNELSDLPQYSSLQDQLAKEQNKSEALAAQVLQLSLELKQAVQSYNNLSRLYRPVFHDIENRLMTMKQESFTLTR